MRHASLALLLVGLVAGCSRGLPARLDGTAAAYRAGEPVFVIDAVATTQDGATGIDVYLGLPPASVVYRRTADSLVATARWTVTVEPERGAPLVRSPLDTLRAATAEGALSVEPHWRRVRIEVPPGRYDIRATLEDLGSERTAERRLEVEVPVRSEGARLGALRFEGEGRDGVGPLDALSVPAGLDSLRVVAEAGGAPEGGVVSATVERVRSDTSAALPLIAFTPSLVSIRARGVDVGETERVDSARRPVEAGGVAVPLAPMGPGVYRVRLALRDADGDSLAGAERLAVVRRRDYPRMARLGDLVEPLVYIGDERDVDRIREQPTAAAQRRAFDRFWGDQMDDRRLASATLRAFYERVEEANRLFGTYKEGWKTDPGMVYVLFGPPRYVESTIDGERWTYGSVGSAPPVFVFERTAGPSQGAYAAPFDVLTLQRDRAYNDSWRRARRQWRTGIVP